ncbi:MAG: HAMP domain-containing sensor histidine kinase [Alphaproteobacteria bacterium]
MAVVGIQDVKQLKTVLQHPLYEREISTSTIGENRLRILQAIYSIRGEGMVQLWLCEDETTPKTAQLSYVYPQPDPKDGEYLIGIEIKCTEGESDAKTSEKIVSRTKQLARSSKSNLLHYEIHPVYRTLNDAPSDEARSDGQQRTLGWVLCGLANEDARWNDFEQCAVQSHLNTLSVLIEQSRLRRVLDASSLCENVLSTTDDVDEALHKTLCILKRSCGASSAYILPVIDGEIQEVEDAASKEDRLAVRKSLSDMSKQSALPNRVTSIPLRGQDKKTKTNNASDEILLVPILAQGVDLGRLSQKSSLLRPVEEDVTVAPMFICALVKKRSANYLGRRFSQTDSAMCELISSMLTSHQFARFYEHQLTKVTKFFTESKEPDHEDQTNAEAQEIQLQELNVTLHEALPTLEGVLSLTVTHDESDVAGIQVSGSSTIDLDKNLESFLRKNTSTILETTEYEAINRDTVVALRSHSQGVIDLVIRMTLSRLPTRYLVLRLSSPRLEQFRLALVRHLAREYSLYQRAVDVRQEVDGMIAQVRHAIMDPLAQAKEHLRSYEMFLRRAQSSRVAQGMFIESGGKLKVFNDGVDSLEDAVRFAETGKFLIAKLTPTNMQTAKYEPNRLVEGARLVVLNRARAKGMRITTRIQGAPQLAYGDVNVIKLALNNLYHNAVKYGRNNTEISIQVRYFRNSWYFSITTVGDYMTEAQLARIFERYVRASRAGGVSRQFGTGIGLPFAKQAIWAHNARSGHEGGLEASSIRVDERESENCFTFSLPYHPFREPQTEQ